MRSLRMIGETPQAADTGDASTIPASSMPEPASTQVSGEMIDAETTDTEEPAQEPVMSQRAAREIGGRDGPDPTRYGDWEKNGRCIDF